VIIVPLLGMLWGDKALVMTWLGAFFWALHVQFIARFSPRVDPIRLSLVQALFTSLISFGVGFFREAFVPQQVLTTSLPILYGGVISIGIDYTMQVVAQRAAKPAHAAIILSLESVFAVFWGWLLLGEILTVRVLSGSALMLIGMLISQIRLTRPLKPGQDREADQDSVSRRRQIQG
jgi:drug/metabolite transporter (DMT)-like permease